MAQKPAVAKTGKIENFDQFVHEEYDNRINWHLKTSKYNRQRYKLYRYSTIILGALATLIASLSTTEIIANSDFWSIVFVIATPVLAATLTIVNSLLQNFQWGAASGYGGKCHLTPKGKASVPCNRR